MGFSTDFSDVNEDYGLIPEGEYEVVIRNIEERTTQNGATGLNLSLVIRNDVNQDCQNRYLFHTLWKRKEPTQADMQVQGYSFKQLMALAKAAKLPNGKAYETVEQLCGDMLKRPLKVTIEHDTYNNKTRERVKYINESEFPDCKHIFKEKNSASSDTFAKPADAPAKGGDALSYSTNLDDFEEILSDGDVPF